MHSDNLKNSCELFFTASRIPLAVFNSAGDLVMAFPSDSPITYLPLRHLEDETKTPSVYIADSHGFYGRIHLTETMDTICIGPVPSVTLSEDILRSCMNENAIPLSLREETFSLLSSVPSMSYVHFGSQIDLLYYCLTQDRVNTSAHFNLHKDQLDEKINKDYVLSATDNKENQTLHNTFYWEQQLYQIIRDGDLHALKTFIGENQKIALLNEGTMAATPLRQAKNLFIGTVTKVGVLAAIPGGLDVEQTYQLIDTYVRECENLMTIESIPALYNSMLIDFTRRLSGKKIPEGISMDIHICMTYIRSHTNEPITLHDVAQQINRSTSYIMKHFKSELGINIGAFITRCRLEEAKSLLTWSEMSLAEISNYLCFSSQSYFQNVFKKKYGVTPMSYRKQHRI